MSSLWQSGTVRSDRPNGKPRIRASIACANCRKRRVKCNIREGSSECDYCVGARLPCVVRDTDARRRPFPPSYAHDLQTRLDTLERMVARSQPPASEGQSLDCEAEESPSERTSTSSVTSSGAVISESRHSDMTDEEYLNQLPARIHQILMHNFWAYYNCELHSIHRPAFELGWRTNSADVYCAFLHLCILGIGLRYSDVADENGASFFQSSSRESVFHQRAFKAAATVIESEPRVCLIQGLLLFGDLEFGIGRNNNGVMHAYLGCQLALQSKFHLRTPNDMALDQVQNRAMCVWTCAMYDRFWALYLNRSSTFSVDQITIERPLDVEARRGDVSSTLAQMENQAYDALIDLLDLLVGFNAREEVQSTSPDQHCYLMIAILHQQLTKWYSKLPKSLMWEPDNIEVAPSSFFSLHQQYHHGIVLLHRTFAFANLSHDSSNEAPLVQEEMDRLYDVPRRLCLDSALQIANILAHHQQRFPMRTIFATSVQHANAAATVLTKALGDKRSLQDPSKHLSALGVLTDYIRQNATTYDAAKKMMTKLEASSRYCHAALQSSSGLSLPSVCSPEARQKPPARHESIDAIPVSKIQGMDTEVSLSAGTTSPPGGSAAGTTWPSFGNIMYANEIAFLSADGMPETL